VDRVVTLICQAVLLVTGTALMGVLTANVIARYVLATGGFVWAEELPEQLFPWFIMAGVALAVQHGGHVSVEWLSASSGAAASGRSSSPARRS
jgi:TRAP-type C4-dicarboxylate transport system permease small subunit